MTTFLTLFIRLRVEYGDRWHRLAMRDFYDVLRKDRREKMTRSNSATFIFEATYALATDGIVKVFADAPTFSRSVFWSCISLLHVKYFTETYARVYTICEMLKVIY